MRTRRITKTRKQLIWNEIWERCVRDVIKGAGDLLSSVEKCAPWYLWRLTIPPTRNLNFFSKNLAGIQDSYFWFSWLVHLRPPGNTCITGCQGLVRLARPDELARLPSIECFRIQFQFKNMNTKMVMTSRSKMSLEKVNEKKLALLYKLAKPAPITWKGTLWHSALGSFSARFL